MFSRIIRLLVTFIVVTISLFTSVTVYASQYSISTKRLSGDNIYGASSAAALSKWKQSDYAILVYGKGLPDAVSAAPLAKKYNAPLLLTEPDFIPTEILDTIKQLSVKNVIIVGGIGDVSSTVEEQLSSLGIAVTRIYGQDRYETGIKVAEQLDNVSEIAIITGEQFTDALSILPIALKRNMPVILVHDNVIPSVVKDYINSHKIAKTYVIGSGTSLNNTILTGLDNIELITGDNKYLINLSINDRFRSDLDLSTTYLSTDNDFGYSICGSVLAGIESHPLILAGNDISYANYFVTNNATNISDINILGSAQEIPNEMVSEVIGMPTNSTPISTSTIDKIEFSSNYLIKTGVDSATFKYRILDQYGKDITDMIPASELAAVTSVSSTIRLNPAFGTGTVIFSSSSNTYKQINITLADKATGKLSMVNAEVVQSTNNTSDILGIAKIDFMSNNLTKTGENSAIFKYRILNKNYADITKSIPFSQISVIVSSKVSVVLEPLSGTGTITYNASSNIEKPITVTLVDNLTGIKATAEFDIKASTQSQ